MVRRAKASGKRGFKGYSSPTQGGWDDPGGGGGDASPPSRSMNSVSLSAKHEPFGMDETRKKNQRKLFWYWNWSRDWHFREVVTVSNIQPEATQSDKLDEESEGNIRAWVWYWRWKDLKSKKRRQGKKRRPDGPPEYSPVMRWIVSLNQRSGKQ